MRNGNTASKIPGLFVFNHVQSFSIELSFKISPEWQTSPRIFRFILMNNKNSSQTIKRYLSNCESLFLRLPPVEDPLASEKIINAKAFIHSHARKLGKVIKIKFRITEFEEFENVLNEINYVLFGN
jgi:hypothetical protein